MFWIFVFDIFIEFCFVVFGDGMCMLFCYEYIGLCFSSWVLLVVFELLVEVGIVLVDCVVIVFGVGFGLFIGLCMVCGVV